MKRFLGLLALLSTLLLCLGGCAPDAARYHETAAASYGDRTVYLDEANFWLRYYENYFNSYEAPLYYYAYGVKDFWRMPSGNHGQSFAEALKESVMAEFLQTYVLLDHAAAYDVSLSGEDLARIDLAVEKLQGSFGEDLSAMGAAYTAEQVKQYLTDRSLAIRVHEAVKAAAGVQAADDGTVFYRLSYFLVPPAEKPSTEEAPTGEVLVRRLRLDLAGGLPAEDVAENWGAALRTATFARNLLDADERFLSMRTQDMKEGEVRVIDAESGWYVVRCEKVGDEEAAAAHLKEQQDALEEKAFTEIYREWAAAAPAFTVKRCFFRLKLHDPV